MATLMVLGCGQDGATDHAARLRAASIEGPALPMCGSASVTLIAGQHIDSGKVTVSNSASSLCVAFATSGDWYLEETHLHLTDQGMSGIPQTRKGNPRPGKFGLRRAHDPPVQTDSYCVDLVQLDYPAGTQLAIAAHASLARLDSAGAAVQSETGWGQGEDMPGRNWGQYFTYAIQPCAEPPPPVADGPMIEPPAPRASGGFRTQTPPSPVAGGFRTQTQGGWGAPCDGGNAGCYRDANFAKCWATLVIGNESCGQALVLSNAAEIEQLLPTEGTPASLAVGTGGVLLGQTVAAMLSVGFDSCDAAFSASTSKLADLVVCPGGDPCAGMTVGAVVDDANALLGGCALTLTADQLNGCLTAINESFVDGNKSGDYLCLP